MSSSVGGCAKADTARSIDRTKAQRFMTGIRRMRDSFLRRENKRARPSAIVARPQSDGVRVEVSVSMCTSIQTLMARKIAGVTGYPQVRYGRGRFGCRQRRTKTPSTVRVEQSVRLNWM